MRQSIADSELYPLQYATVSCITNRIIADKTNIFEIVAMIEVHAWSSHIIY